MQDGEVIGIARQRMGHPVLRPDLRRQHRPGVDAAGLGAEQPPAPTEHRAELALADGSDLADPLELVVVEPPADVIGDLGQHLHAMGREESLLVALGNPERRSQHPIDPGRRFGDQLVHRHAHGERQP
jgi:hypothetical protein